MHCLIEEGFRPLAVKLRAKTAERLDDVEEFLSFPSPCGEIKGQNGFLEIADECWDQFPSPCGEIKGQNGT